MSSTTTTTTMEWSEEQTHALALFRTGKNLFLTGPGGSGKSELIRRIYQDALSNGRRIQVTALTGCAAILLQSHATTLHRWAGVGLCNGDTKRIVRRVCESKHRKKNWLKTDVLVVDEVSMMSQKILDTLNQIGKIARKNTLPWGGMQIVFVGDFYQLPPVGDIDDPDSCRFCFESPDWFDIFPREQHILLTRVYRQKDPVYASILNDIREGIVRKKHNEVLLSRVRRPVTASPTQLFPRKQQVERINQEEMKKLEGKEECNFVLAHHMDLPLTEAQKNANNTTINHHHQNITQEDKEHEIAYLQNNLLCESYLCLRVGAHVMCIVNREVPLSPGNPEKALLCNGSQGVIVGFVSGFAFPSQQQNAPMSITNNNNNNNNNNKLPLVRFHGFAQDIVITPHVWASETIPGIGVSQIPLILSWAITIHKSQGLSLDTADMDVGSGIFEAGQTYVALSRVKSLEGLYLSSFDYQKIKVNKKVREFYQALCKKTEPTPEPSTHATTTTGTTAAASTDNIRTISLTRNAAVYAYT
jgi:ATP-dependent DNA helicase PIF1